MFSLPELSQVLPKLSCWQCCQSKQSICAYQNMPIHQSYLGTLVKLCISCISHMKNKVCWLFFVWQWLNLSWVSLVLCLTGHIVTYMFLHYHLLWLCVPLCHCHWFAGHDSLFVCCLHNVFITDVLCKARKMWSLTSEAIRVCRKNWLRQGSSCAWRKNKFVTCVVNLVNRECHFARLRLMSGRLSMSWIPVGRLCEKRKTSITPAKSSLPKRPNSYVYTKLSRNRRGPRQRSRN